MRLLALFTQIWNWLKVNDKMITEFLENFITEVFLNLVNTSHLTPKATLRSQTHKQKVGFENCATPKMSNSPVFSSGSSWKTIAQECNRQGTFFQRTESAAFI